MKEFLKEHEDKIVLAVGGILIASVAFLAGQLSLKAEEKTPITIEEPKIEEIAQDTEKVVEAASAQEQPSQNQGQKTAGEESKDQEASQSTDAKQNEFGGYVASKNSELYHPIDCSFAQRIKEENRIYFDSQQEAEEAGFKPSSCFDKK